MRIELIFVGKTSLPEIDEGIKRYLERLRHYIPAHVHIVKPEKISKKTTEQKVRQLEGERILRVVEAGGHLLVWDQRGTNLDSIAFARLLERLKNQSTPRLWTVIGGPVGLSEAVIERADSVISLSKMTFPHDLARLVVLEQLYRAFTIIEGIPYHK
ncbi:MAG: 23S rRNA (pseudouridine(1915)-N(3))-methyltransferase RlmH [Desulforhabdus sp.]|jgi:23S rRNA (pseudouridine1915-N3)-methyltransferase|nr:23S rRNA (pseudouridine(1915)-N(3))-methyltransferase RlmH [Desulforhabdus sp.]